VGDRLRISNWEKFQHYQHRRPPWIKLYHDLLDDPEYHDMDAEAAKYLPLAWLIASEDDGYLPASDELAFRLRVDSAKLPGFLTHWGKWISGDASGMLADCKHDASDMLPQRQSRDRVEAETETEEEVVANSATAVDKVAEKRRRDLQAWESWKQIQIAKDPDLSKITAHYLKSLESAVDEFYSRSGGRFTERRKAILAGQLSDVGFEPLLSAIEVYVDSYSGLKDERYFKGIAKKNSRELTSRQLDADIDRHRNKMRGAGLNAEVNSAGV